MYTVEIKQFKGPLDLLLDLIESEKLDICQISLSKITEAYLDRVNHIEGDSTELADFLVVAAKLLYLKSRELLPDIRTEEEDAEIEELEKNLIEYQKYKYAAEELEAILSRNYRSFTRKSVENDPGGFFPPDITKEKLMVLFSEALKKVESVPEEEAIKPVKITLEERKAFIKKSMSGGKASLKTLLARSRSKVEVIVTFLAILEMIRTKELKAAQEVNFADLILYRVK